MKKTFYFFVLSAVVALSVNAQSNRVAQQVTPPVPAPAFVPTVEGAEIQFEKMIHDYGEVAHGANGDIEFKFKNIGSEPLILFDVRVSCGSCLTIQSWPREPIMPGQEGVIKVGYNTTILGPMSKTITLFSNAKTDRVVLRTTGNVNPK
jgi:hypothetical protein